MRLGTTTALIAIVGALATPSTAGTTFSSSTPPSATPPPAEPRTAEALAGAAGEVPPGRTLPGEFLPAEPLPAAPAAGPAGPAAAPGSVLAVAESRAAPESAPSTTWSVDLAAGEAAGVSLVGGTARLDPAGAFLAPVEDTAGEETGVQRRAFSTPIDGAPAETTGDGTPSAETAAAGEAAAAGETAAGADAAVPTGLLTLPAQELGITTDQVGTTVLGDVPAGSTATIDVRGRAAAGTWSEWIPAGGAGGRIATLPEPATEVQGRLVLTGPAGVAPTTGPAVRSVALTAHSTTRAVARTEKAALRSRVFATREGLVGRTTANGHVITKRDRFVALPSRRALSPRGARDYSVRVCAPNGRCAVAPVWDVGPWNTRDDYWNPASQRQEWKDLPRGMPEAQAARTRGYNGGKDQFGRKVANPAGIDLADGLFWDALGLKDNSWVTVDYLWTGSARPSAVAGSGEAAADVEGQDDGDVQQASDADTGDASTADASTADAATGDADTGDADTGDADTGRPDTGDTATSDPVDPADTGDPTSSDPTTTDPTTTDPTTTDPTTTDSTTTDPTTDGAERTNSAVASG